MSGQKTPDELPPLPPGRRMPPLARGESVARYLPAAHPFGQEPILLDVPGHFVHAGELEWITRHRTVQVVKAVFRVVVLLIALRFVLLLLGANSDAAFARIVYGITAPLIFLFQEAFPDPQRHGRMVEAASLLAMVVYWLLGRIIARFVYLRKSQSHR